MTERFYLDERQFERLMRALDHIRCALEHAASVGTDVDLHHDVTREDCAICLARAKEASK